MTKSGQVIPLMPDVTCADVICIHSWRLLSALTYSGHSPLSQEMSHFDPKHGLCMATLEQIATGSADNSGRIDYGTILVVRQARETDRHEHV